MVDAAPEHTEPKASNDALFEFDKAALMPKPEVTSRRVANIIRDHKPRAVCSIGRSNWPVAPNETGMRDNPPRRAAAEPPRGGAARALNAQAG